MCADRRRSSPTKYSSNSHAAPGLAAISQRQSIHSTGARTNRAAVILRFSGGASNPRVPLVALIFPITTLAPADFFQAGDELKRANIFGVLVAELILDAQA